MDDIAGENPVAFLKFESKQMEDVKKYFSENKPTYETTRFIEEALLAWLNSADVVDPRWKAIAKTHFEEGFMAFRRAFFKN